MVDTNVSFNGKSINISQLIKNFDRFYQDSNSLPSLSQFDEDDDTFKGRINECKGIDSIEPLVSAGSLLIIFWMHILLSSFIQ